MIAPAEVKALLPAARRRRRGRRRVHCRRTARPTRSTSPRRSPRARASAARGSSRTCKVTGITEANGPGRRASRPSRARSRAERRGQLRRHVGARARRAWPASPCRCMPASISTSSPSRSPGAARPAGAARAGRVHLLQGGRRQAAGRRLRAGGQALGHGRHPRGFLLRPAARGLGPFRADPREARCAACRCWRRAGIQHLLQRPGELHPRRPLPSRRGAGARGLLRRLRLQLDRHPVGRRRRQGAGANGSTTASRRSTSGTSTSAACSRSRATARYLRDRATETLGLLYADHLPYRQFATRARRAPLAAARAADGARRRASARSPAGSGRTGSRRPASSREYRYTYGRQNWFEHSARRAPGGARRASACSTCRSFGKFLRRGPRRLSGPAAALRQRRRRRARPDRLHAMAERARRHRGRPHRHAARRDRFLVVTGAASQTRDLAWLQPPHPGRRAVRRHRRHLGPGGARPDGAALARRCCSS